MPRGRPPIYRTKAQRVAARQQQVRENVRAFRRRLQGAADDAAQGSQQEPQLPSEVLMTSEEASDVDYQAFFAPLTYPIETTLIYCPISSSQSIHEPNVRCHSQDGNSAWTVDFPFSINTRREDFANFFVTVSHWRTISTLALDRVDVIAYTEIHICIALWTTKFVFRTNSEESDILIDAVITMALLYTSEIKSDPQLSLEAFRAKDRVLNKFRTCLDIYMKKKEVGLLRILCTTALVLASLEYVINRSWKDASRNLVGIGALLESTGPEVLDQLDDVKEYFSCYRVLQAPFTFFFRQKTFLGRPEWIGRLWQPHFSSQPQFFQALLDIAYLVPAEAELYDNTQSRSLGLLDAQLERLRSIGDSMNQWEVEYLATHPAGLYTTAPSTWGTPFDLSFQYTTPEQAAIYISYLGFRLTVWHLIIQIKEDLSQDRSIENSIETSVSGIPRILTQICQSMEYFLPRGNKIVGSIMAIYPFDLAWRILLEMSGDGVWLEEELVWCEMTAQRIDGAGLFVFTDWTRNKL